MNKFKINIMTEVALEIPTFFRDDEHDIYAVYTEDEVLNIYNEQGEIGTKEFSLKNFDDNRLQLVDIITKEEFITQITKWYDDAKADIFKTVFQNKKAGEK